MFRVRGSVVKVAVRDGDSAEVQLFRRPRRGGSLLVASSVIRTELGAVAGRARQERPPVEAVGMSDATEVGRAPLKG